MYLIIFSLWAAAIIGWIMNILSIISTCCAVINGLLVVKIIGIVVFPLGAFLGYF